METVITFTPIKISQSDLLDFAMTSGVAQQTKVRAVKCRPEYDPKNDYWKRLRDRITKMHSREEPLTVLDELCTLVPDSKKANYTRAVEVYKRFLRGKTIEWFKPIHRIWRHGELEVSINPELGLVINGTPHVIKLYFREEKLSKDKTAGIIQLMETTLEGYHPEETVYSVLDVPNNKLLTKNQKHDLMPLIRAHALAFVQIYHEL
ncbi:hypothetical protein FHS57_004296 [Runella defluvii]|uniref:Uncharacterized protein n=1 Tax=Runella defluvii TaxID=370973 RepID=A0A7W5ZNT7_9BACT|nr:hypothetical protein [Runella defluvii]MBB3840276.1 hypothetical protein [Runella defluvii]